MYNIYYNLQSSTTQSHRKHQRCNTSQRVKVQQPANSTSLIRSFIRELKQPRRRRRQERHKFAYLTMKTVVLHVLHVHFPFMQVL